MEKEKKSKSPSTFRKHKIKGKDVHGNPCVIFVMWKMFLYQVHKIFPDSKVKRVS